MHTATHATHATSFKALVAANRAAGRLSEPVAPKLPEAEIARRQAGMRLTQFEYDQAKQLAADECRSAAGFMRWMYLRGLLAYLAEQDSAPGAPAAP